MRHIPQILEHFLSRCYRFTRAAGAFIKCIPGVSDTSVSSRRLEYKQLAGLVSPAVVNSRRAEEHTISGTQEQGEVSPSPLPGQIVEAIGWVKGSNGEVTLVAQAPNATPHSPCLKSPSCQDLQVLND